MPGRESTGEGRAIATTGAPGTRPGEKRTYRRRARLDRLTAFQVTVQETDLWIQADQDWSERCRDAILVQRGYLERYIRSFPAFRESLKPWQPDGPVPAIVHRMIAAGRAAGVGPMAAVAGALAEAVGESLRQVSQEVIVENGGDIYMAVEGEVTVGFFAGRSPLSMQVGLRLNPGATPIGLCTSSGTVGHSLSRGRADAVCILARNCALADAVATGTANRIQRAADIPGAIRFARGIQGVEGVAAVCGERLGLWGDLRLVPLKGRKKA